MKNKNLINLEKISSTLTMLLAVDWFLKLNQQQYVIVLH